MSAQPNEINRIHQNSPVLMQEAISGLLSGRTVSQVAETMGIPKTRITRWYRTNKQFAKLLEETTQDVIEVIRAQTVSEVADKMTDLMPVAVDVLQDAMTSEKMSERITAANSVLKFSGLGRKQDGPAVPVEGLIRKVTGGPATGD